jgi:glycosyltransferase involved in cell wall biosynthesis
MTNTVAQDTVAPSFIVFSDDWGVHPSSCQHLFRHIATKYLVLWVNTIGMRRPKFSMSDFRKVYQKSSRMLRGSYVDKKKADNLFLHICQPFMLPFSSVPFIRRLNQYFVTRTVQRYTRKLNMTHSILVSTVPNACDYIGFFNEKKAIYYCVDDFTQWPGFEHDLVCEMDKQMVTKASMLVATSQKLYQRLVLSGKPTYLLTHGVDIEMFIKVPDQEHNCLNKIPKPRAGYFGLIDERSDQDLILAVASKMKDFSFVMTGAIVANVACLKACLNIYFTGPVAYEELPALIKGLDVLFIPYVVSDFTDSISPLKLKEYLVTGKPVITTPLAEAFLYEKHITIAATVEDWLAALKSAMMIDFAINKETTLESINNESWEGKAELFLTIALYN